MTFYLYSTGKLAKGTDEKQAVAAIARLTGITESKVRERLINGQRRRLASDVDEDKLHKARDRLLAAGLVVEVVGESPVKRGASPDPTSERGLKGGSAYIRTLLTLTIVTVIMIVAAGWYWINRPISDDALAIEGAVADGKLTAIAYLDVAKVAFIKSQWFGESDPSPISITKEGRELLTRLFTGEANLRDNLKHAFFAVHTLDGQKEAEDTLVLGGDFEDAAIRATLASDYRLEPLGGGSWSMLRLPKEVGGLRCPEPQPSTPGDVAQPLYLHVMPQWLLLSTSEAQVQHLQQRLINRASAEQSLEVWRNYRRGQLGSLMVFTPAEASKGINGLPGMIARKASKDTPEVTGLAARVGLAPLSAGLRAGVTVFSADAEWNREQASKLRAGITRWSQDSQSVSPTLNLLLSRIVVGESTEQLQIEADLDGQVLNEFGQIVQEAIGRVFSVKDADSQKDNGPVVDEIMNSPIDYAAIAALDKLPAYEVSSFSNPLFIEGGFAVNIETVSLNDDGLFEFKIKGEVALAKAGVNESRSGTVTLLIDEVSNAEGMSVLRDERCSEQPEWKKANHEPSVSKSIFNNKAKVDKAVRLKEGVRPEDVEAVKGRMSFVAPVKVKRFTLPATAGGHIEHMGMRFYVKGVDADGSISFQISGEKGRFLELRALNKDGLPLKTGWSMGSVDDSRKTQYFKGNIHSLEIYVAEDFVKHKKAFTLKRLFVAPSGNEQSSGKVWFAPDAISVSAWGKYVGVDMKKLNASRKGREPHRQDQLGKALATVTRGPITMELNHKVKRWGNYPMATIYFPMVPDFPGVLSALSYRIEEPARETTGVERFTKIFYPYRTSSGKVVGTHQINGKPFAKKQIQLKAGLKENEKIERLKGSLRFRLPTRTVTTRLALDELWQGTSVDGVTVTLKSIERGMFPGYALKIEGAIERLVNLHGLSVKGQRVAAKPVNFQNGGYWTMTLPLSPGMREVELVLAAEQKVYEFPFDVRPGYTD